MAKGTLRIIAAAVAALLLPLATAAQSDPCSRLMDVTCDEVTGTTVTRMKEYLILEKEGEPGAKTGKFTS